MKYPIGIQTFEKIINDGFVYVDKTDLIYSLVKGGQIYFLSSPTFREKSFALHATFLFRRQEGIIYWLEDRGFGARLACASGVSFRFQWNQLHSAGSFTHEN